MKRYGNLFARVCSFANLHAAYQEARRGKRRKAYIREFELHLERNLFEMRDELLDGTYRWGSYRVFTVRDPKRRTIMAAPFRDRVLHHAVVRVVEPIFDRSFIDHAYACRQGKGNLAAVLSFARHVRGNPDAYVLKCDVSRYFQSVDHGILMGLVERKIKDPGLLALIRSLVATAPADPAFGEGRGMPIGNLTSQLFANVYLSPLDRHVKQALGMRHYWRYVDDILVAHRSKERLHLARREIGAFLGDLELELHPKKQTVSPARCGVDFLGYVVYPTHLRVRSEAVRRFRRRERRLKRAYWEGGISAERYWRSVQSWVAHASWADTRRMLARMGLKHART